MYFYGVISTEDQSGSSSQESLEKGDIYKQYRREYLAFRSAMLLCFSSYRILSWLYFSNHSVHTKLQSVDPH